MGKKQNLTVQLDAEVIQKARALAAQRSTSISRLVAEEIERLVGEEDRYQLALKQALSHLDAGFHLGGDDLPRRDDLHER